jgi:hypothetical protein
MPRAGETACPTLAVPSVVSARWGRRFRLPECFTDPYGRGSVTSVGEPRLSEAAVETGNEMTYGSVNVSSADCAAIAMYCLPSTAYEIGELIIRAPVW